jgi:L-fuconolactonase
VYLLYIALVEITDPHRRPTMRIIDTHCHTSPHWYEPVESLLYQMDQHGVACAVLVQLQGQYDNSYQLACQQRYPGRFVSVVLVDTNDPSAPAALEQLAAAGARGVRLRAGTRSPGTDPLAIWRKASELGLSVSCSGNSDDFVAERFAEVCEAFPTLPIIIEHLGGLKVTEQGLPPVETQQRIFALARYPNVYLKIHGLGEFCRRNQPVTTPFPFDRAGLALLHGAYDAFGPHRLMWGSDYPPVSGREGYGNALHLPLAELADKSEDERALIFGGVAARVYGLE